MSKMSTVLKMMTKNKDINRKIVKSNYDNSRPEELLYDILKYKGNMYEDKKLSFLEALFDIGYDVNNTIYLYGEIYNILQQALNYEFSEQFLLDLFKLAIKHGINVNFTNYDYMSVGPYLINIRRKNQNITPLYKLLVENGYDIFYTDLCFRSLEDRINELDTKIKDKDEFIKEYQKDRKKLYKEKLKNYIDKLNESYEDLNYIGLNSFTLLFHVVDRKYDEKITYEVIKYLLDNDLNPNKIAETEINFIEYAILCGHSDKYIYKLIDLALNYNFNINYQDSQGKTIMNYLIKKNNKNRNITPIFELLLNNGFVYNIKDKEGNTFYDILIKSNNSNILDKDEFIKKYSNLFYPTDEIINNNINEVKDIGYLYTYSNDCKEPIISLDSKKLEKDKCLLIIGKEGIGKTTYLNNLANQLTKNNDKVFFTSAKDIINNCTSISMVKELLLDLIHKCIDNNMILFIDDFDKLYNFKNLKYLKEEINILLNYYTSKKNLSLVVTLNKENKDYVLDDALIEASSILKIKEYTNEQLNSLFDDIINKYNKSINVTYLNLLKQIILNIVNEQNIINYENISKLKIVNELIENSFKYKEEFNIDNIIYAFKLSNYLKENIKEIICEELSKLYILNEKNIQNFIIKLTK